jgi:glycosidase
MLKQVKETYPEKNLNILQNLVDSHDTDRLASMIKNPDRQFDRNCNEENPDYNPGKPSLEEYEKQKMIAAFQITYQGAPMIYYGDEAGMWGADDPHCRKPMIWDDMQYDAEVIDASSGFENGFATYPVEPNIDLSGFYQKLIQIRNGSNALKKGSLDFIYYNDNKQTFSFLRNYSDEVCVAAFNLGAESDTFNVSVPVIKAAYQELLNGESGMVYSDAGSAVFEITIPPGSFRIYKFSKLNG